MTEEPTPTRTRKSVVAIVDDDDDQRALLRRALSVRGYATLEFRSAEEALGWESPKGREAESPLSKSDLILLDINLPGLSGVETIGLIKETPSLRQIPVAMLTARRETETVLKCIQAGAGDYFVKPYRFDEVLRRIDKILTDPRGLLSRTASVELSWSLQDHLVREIKRAERSGEEFALILGAVRKSPGGSDERPPAAVDLLETHSAPDRRVLRHVVSDLLQRVQPSLREYDLLVPFGEAEFAAVLPNTGRAGAHAVVRKIHERFESVSGLPPLERKENLLLYVGEGIYPENGKDRSELFEDAESRLSTKPPLHVDRVPGSEKSFLKTQKCHGCGRHFSFPKIAARRMVADGRESDLRLIYSDLDPLYFGVATCSHCGLSVMEADLGAFRFLDSPAFGWEYVHRAEGEPPRHPTKTILPGELLRSLTPPFDAVPSGEDSSVSPQEVTIGLSSHEDWIEESRRFRGIRPTREVALVRHLLARETYRLAGGSPLRRARLAHRLAWLHRAGRESAGEKRYIEEAREFYLAAFHFEDLAETKPNELEVFYLLGELSFRLGKQSEAVSVFERLVHDPRLEAKPSFRKMVHRRWFQARREDGEGDASPL